MCWYTAVFKVLKKCKNFRNVNFEVSLDDLAFIIHTLQSRLIVRNNVVVFDQFYENTKSNIRRGMKNQNSCNEIHSLNISTLIVVIDCEHLKNLIQSSTSRRSLVLKMRMLWIRSMQIFKNLRFSRLVSILCVKWMKNFIFKALLRIKMISVFLKHFHQPLFSKWATFQSYIFSWFGTRASIIRIIVRRVFGWDSFIKATFMKVCCKVQLETLIRHTNFLSSILYFFS